VFVRLSDENPGLNRGKPSKRGVFAFLYKTALPPRSELARFSRSSAGQADLLRDALVSLGIKRPIVLGHSWGAAVALALGLNHPDAVGGLVLLSGYYYPSLRADVLLSSPAAIPILGDLLRYSISPLLGRLLQPLVLKGMFAPLPVPANFTKGSACRI
jgi:pimeloyl-ACP methyl ester carboxylesterase